MRPKNTKADLSPGSANHLVSKRSLLKVCSIFSLLHLFYHCLQIFASFFPLSPIFSKSSVHFHLLAPLSSLSFLGILQVLSTKKYLVTVLIFFSTAKTQYEESLSYCLALVAGLLVAFSNDLLVFERVPTCTVPLERLNQLTKGLGWVMAPVYVTISFFQTMLGISHISSENLLTSELVSQMGIAGPHTFAEAVLLSRKPVLLDIAGSLYRECIIVFILQRSLLYWLRDWSNSSAQARHIIFKLKIYFK